MADNLSKEATEELEKHKRGFEDAQVRIGALGEDITNKNKQITGLHAENVQMQTRIQALNNSMNQMITVLSGMKYRMALIQGQEMIRKDQKVEKPKDIVEEVVDSNPEEKEEEMKEIKETDEQIKATEKMSKWEGMKDKEIIAKLKLELQEKDNLLERILQSDPTPNVRQMISQSGFHSTSEDLDNLEGDLGDIKHIKEQFVTKMKNMIEGEERRYNSALEFNEFAGIEMGHEENMLSLEIDGVLNSFTGIYKGLTLQRGLLNKNQEVYIIYIYIYDCINIGSLSISRKKGEREGGIKGRVEGKEHRNR